MDDHTYGQDELFDRFIRRHLMNVFDLRTRDPSRAWGADGVSRRR
jgi:hypothetical protein